MLKSLILCFVIIAYVSGDTVPLIAEQAKPYLQSALDAAKLGGSSYVRYVMFSNMYCF